jgi:hypothetical protein
LFRWRQQLCERIQVPAAFNSACVTEMVEAAISPIALTGSVDEGEIARLAGVVCSFRLRRQVLFLSAITIERLFADAGYRGHNAPPDYKFRVYTSGQKRRLTPQIKRELRRRCHRTSYRSSQSRAPHEPAMPLMPCSQRPPTTSISCLNGWSSCCPDSWRLEKQLLPFIGSKKRKLHGRREYSFWSGRNTGVTASRVMCRSHCLLNIRRQGIAFDFAEFIAERIEIKQPSRAVFCSFVTFRRSR